MERENVEREAPRNCAKPNPFSDLCPAEIQPISIFFHQKNLGLLLIVHLQLQIKKKLKRSREIKFAIYQVLFMFESLLRNQSRARPEIGIVINDLPYREGISLESVTKTLCKIIQENDSKWRWKMRKKKVRDRSWMEARRREGSRAGSLGIVTGLMSLLSIVISSLGGFVKFWCGLRSQMYLPYRLPVSRYCIIAVFMMMDKDDDRQQMIFLASSKAEEADEVLADRFSLDLVEEAIKVDLKKDDKEYSIQRRVYSSLLTAQCFCDYTEQETRKVL